MRKILFFTAATMMMFCACRESKPGKTEGSVEELVKEAYIYAFPAVEHDKLIWTILTDAEVPVNKLLTNNRLLTPEDTSVVSPNNDTFYSYAVADIRYEPVIFKIPEINDRYFSIQLCDIFTNCPDYISTLATGEGPGNYMIARSDWEGDTPADVDRVINIPATIVLALCRTQVFGPEDDEAGVIAQSYEAVPLSAFTGTEAPAGEALEWSKELYDAKTGDAEGFFSTFNRIVQYQILNDSDKALMKKFAAIGLGQGEDFMASKFSAETWAAIEAGANAGREEIREQAASVGTSINNWDFSPSNSGRWGTDYMTRAAAAWQYIYVNTHEEAVYAIANRDADSNRLNGANKYTITFSADEVPEVEFFWSLTMYNTNGFLVENAEKRYNIKDIDDLTFGDDGSLELFLQSEDPGEEFKNNWLPAPEGDFYLILRLYGPSAEAIEGSLVIPAVTKRN